MVGVDEPIGVVYPAGPHLDTLMALLDSPDLIPPEKVGLGIAHRLIATHPRYLQAVRSAASAATAVLALVEHPEQIDGALSDGADDVVLWPGSAKLVQRRFAAWAFGQLGPGRLLLDAHRTTSFVHAIRNPLNVITLYAELLRLDPLSEDALGSVGRMVRAAKRVDALVGELETLLYLESDKASVRMQPTELNALVERVIAEHTYDIEDKPLSVTARYAEGGLMAWADPDLSRRALHAVFGRVAKMALGGSNVVVTVSQHEERRGISIQAPIQPLDEAQQRSFRSAAAELDARESLGGVGVGLSFANQVLGKMEGLLLHQVGEQGEAVTGLWFKEPPAV